jgi:site-specific recombinase
MLPCFLLLLLQLMGLSLTLVMAVRHPSWRAAVLVGVAVRTCVGAGYQVSLQRITSVTLVGILGLDIRLLVQLQSLAIRPVPRQRSRDAWWC